MSAGPLQALASRAVGGAVRRPHRTLARAMVVMSESVEMYGR